MEKIKIQFNGFIEVQKNDIKLFDADGDHLEQHIINKLSTEQIVEGLEDGTYMLEFVGTYSSAVVGEETYEFSVSIE